MREDLRNADEDLTPVDVETALAKLRPRPASVDRDRLLFLAGRAAAIADTAAPQPRRRRLWPTAAVASFAAAMLFGVLYGMERSRPQPPQRIVYVDRIVERTPVAGRQDPRGVHRQPDASTVVDGSSRDWFAASRLLRSRHPALMTDADDLPAVRFGGGGAGAEQPTVRRMRQSLLGRSLGTESDSGISLHTFFSLGGR